jgi:UDP-N-acetylglucosamine diphosphorylase / glucose-1-phosphate thymidylyltransferase / UDP-N-acetylgalactosamine diphosphorylase / glucosamine-1-phosphate N-acetyltransferase / galactosamine-1-phosphate N-acetyltransferase
MKRWLVLFENGEWSALRPLTDLLPPPALAFGGSDLATRWATRARATLLACEARPSALAAWRGAPRASAERPAPSDWVIVADAAALPGAWLEPLVEARPALWIGDTGVVGALLRYEQVAPALGSGERFAGFLRDLERERGLLRIMPVEAEVLRWPWQLIEHNERAIAEDLSGLVPENLGEVHPSVAVLEPSRVRVEKDARVDPHVVLDAREGPIHLGEGVIVRAQTVVVGPCVVGAGTELLGGLIARSTIGPGCRLAGEIDATIWQGWANKRHHGFIGHAVIGEWTNLGALTTNSDLKNNYGTVRVWVEGREVDTGLTKVGALVGSHVKTGIGSLLPTGASIGSGSNLFGGGRFAPKRIPPFSWWDGERTVDHEIERFLATARVAESRRGLALETGEEAALRALHAASAAEREAARPRPPAATGVRASS